MVQREMKEGDWTCPSCNNHNFASRQVCNRCGGPKPPPEGVGRPGDWLCPECNNHNWARRETCNKCNAPKPGSGGGGPPPRDRGPPPRRDEPSRGRPSFEGRLPPAPAPPMSSARDRGGDRDGPRNQQFREGDWSCQDCGNHNFANRFECNRCGAPKPAERPVERRSSYDDRDRRPPPPSPRAAPVARDRGGDRGGGRGPQFKEGDWNCVECGNHNFASRLECNKCAAPKPMDDDRRGAYSDDRGADYGAARRAPAPSRSSPYSEPRSSPYSEPPPSRRLPAPPAPPTSGGKGGREMREGDWICPDCGNHNFKSRDNCNRCGAEKVIEAKRPANFKEGDWMCPSCGNHNFASRTECKKCGEPK